MADTEKKGGTGEEARNQEEENSEQSRYVDPHGNQTLREPSGGMGAGKSRGDASSYMPDEPGEGRNPRADSQPMNPVNPGADAHTQPVEGGRDQHGSR